MKSIEFGVRKPTSNGFEKRPVERNKGSMTKGINTSKAGGSVTVINGSWNKNSKKA